MKEFNYQSADSQGTVLNPLKPGGFAINKYSEYEAALLERNQKFWESRSGIAVYRRFRVPQVFSYGCRDREYSLGLQLAALQESMKYKCDIANFLEPWYGIGTIASAFGLEYIWPENQAPVTKAPFRSISEALDYPFEAVEKTVIGRHTLAMIEYFLEKTQGKIPLSLTDTQAPLNIASYLIALTDLFLEIYDHPEDYRKLLNRIADLLINFTNKQRQLIGNALVSPGHGFASSRSFEGIGMSDDNMLMISDDMYGENEAPIREKIGAGFGGTAFHSCGDWSRKIPVVKQIKNLVMVDGAFSAETDPDPNDDESFAGQFVNTGVILNARIVGDGETIIAHVKKLWRPGLKLIVATYCPTPAEQKTVYDSLHELCESE